MPGRRSPNLSAPCSAASCACWSVWFSGPRRVNDRCDLYVHVRKSRKRCAFTHFLFIRDSLSRRCRHPHGRRLQELEQRAGHGRQVARAGESNIEAQPYKKRKDLRQLQWYGATLARVAPCLPRYFPVIPCSRKRNLRKRAGFERDRCAE